MSKKITLNMLNIELVNGCNFRCRMCDAVKYLKSHMRYMSIQTAKNIVKHVNSDVDEITSIWPYSYGEPLAHPEIYRILEVLNEIKRPKECPVVLSTNASLLRGEAAYALLEIPFVTQLKISFDGFGDEESYKNLRGNHYYEVVDNVRNFVLIVKRKRPELYISTTSIYPGKEFMPKEMHIPSFEEAKKGMEKVFTPMGVDVGMRYLHGHNEWEQVLSQKTVARKTPPQKAGTIAISGEQTPQEIPINPPSPTKKPQAFRCWQLEENYFGIGFDGKLRPCHSTVIDEFYIGDLNHQGFKEILTSEKYLKLRHDLRLDRRENHDVCAKCSSGEAMDSVATTIKFWKEKLSTGEVTDPEELEYLSELVREDA